MEPMIRAVLIAGAALALLGFGAYLILDDGSAGPTDIAGELAMESDADDEGALRKRAIISTAAARKGRKVVAKPELKQPVGKPVKSDPNPE
jgi:hypothetical protein